MCASAIPGVTEGLAALLEAVDEEAEELAPRMAKDMEEHREAEAGRRIRSLPSGQTQPT